MNSRRFAILAGCLALSGACGRLRFEDRSTAEHDDASTGAQGDRDDAGELTEDATAEQMLPAEDARVGDDAGMIADAELDAQSADAGAADAMSDGDAGSAVVEAGADAGARACAPGLTGAACDVCVRYVDLNSSAASPDGLSWQTAFKTILAGESAAYSLATSSGPSSCQVWVREGRYFMYVDHPINGLAVTNFGPLYGGFAGNEVQLSQRDLTAHTTIIDGASPDGTQHVLNPVYASSGAYLDGFTVTGARNIETGTFANAGGLDLAGGTVQLRNMTITGNECVGNGAGLYVENTQLIIEDSRIIGNQADGSGGGLALGAGVSQLTLRNVLFANNVAGGDGGALFVASAAGTPLPLTFANVAAAQNTAGGRAGAFYMTNVAGTLSAISSGNNGAGASASGSLLSCPTSCMFANSIFWDPSSLPELALSGTTSLARSIVRGGATGVSISTADPLFVSASDLHLRASSPAIDAADGCKSPELDLEGQSRVDVATVTNSGVSPFSDLGAYEAQLDGTRYGAFSVLCPK